MTDKQPEALRLADTLDLAPENGIEPQTAEDAAAELRRLHTENTALQQGYAAARLEIESLQDRIKTMAEQHADELMVAHFDGRMRAAQPENLRCKSTQKRLATQWGFVPAGAQQPGTSHGQAPAQAAPAAVAGPSEAVAYLDIGAGGYLDLGTDLSNEALSRLPKGRHVLVIAGTYGIDGYTAAPNTQPAPDEILNMAREQGLPETETEGVFRVNVDDLGRMFAADRAARATADSVTAPAGGANWQDISTAPKDGTRFVAVGQNYGLDSETQHTCIAQRLAGCWVEVSEWNGASKLKYLTHWMPLPPLPGSAASAPADSVTAPQQEAQEPVAWYVTGGSRLLDEDEAKAEARHIGGTARAMPLYTAPPPSPRIAGEHAAQRAYVRYGS